MKNSKTNFSRMKEIQFKNILLNTENKKLQEENELLTDKVEILQQLTGIFSVQLASKYKQTLQEIKDLAENRTYYIDFTRSKSYLELEQDYAKITNDLENRLFKILQKISEVME